MVLSVEVLKRKTGQRESGKLRMGREGRSFKDIFLFSVDGHPLIYIPNTALMVTDQS